MQINFVDVEDDKFIGNSLEKRLFLKVKINFYGKYIKNKSNLYSKYIRNISCLNYHYILFK